MIDLLIIHIWAFYFFSETYDIINFIAFVTLGWVILSLKSSFYEIYRFTHVSKIMSLIGKQFIIFLLIVFAYFGIFNAENESSLTVINYVLLVMACITVIKFTIYFLLKRYRLLTGGNKRKVVIIGLNKKTDQLRKFFSDNPEYGYQLDKIFSLKGPQKTTIDNCIEYITDNNVDEIYSSVAELNNADLIRLIDYVDNNLKTLKFLPDNKEIYSKKLDFSYYGVLPILSLRKIPMDEPFNQFIKRGFDIILSLFVIIGILSWLTPILAILIKLESKELDFEKALVILRSLNLLQNYSYSTLLVVFQLSRLIELGSSK